jgi:flagellar biosynthesis/type III secretory pathway ATPase
VITCIITFIGHGGRQIADFLEETLEKNIAVELKEPDDATILERISRCDYVVKKKWNSMT